MRGGGVVCDVMSHQNTTIVRNMRCSKRREIWLTELFRELGWLSLFHFLKQPFTVHDCNGLNTDAER